MRSETTYRSGFQLVAVSPGGAAHPEIPVAAARGGYGGLLDLSLCSRSASARADVEQFRDMVLGKSAGVILDPSLAETCEAVIADGQGLDLLVFYPSDDLARWVARARTVARRVGLIVMCPEHAALARQTQVDFVVAKGNEAGGIVGEETTFILMQRLLDDPGVPLPVYGWGGIGAYSAAACRAAGAAGAILDWQLACCLESDVDPAMKRRIASMDASETTTVHGPEQETLRCFDAPGFTAVRSLRDFAETAPGAAAWRAKVAELVHMPDPDSRLWLLSQDAALAPHLGKDRVGVVRVLREIDTASRQQVAAASAAPVLGPGGPLALSHGTEFPIVQGPMTRVSDSPAFAKAVADSGALPFLALALLAEDDVRRIMLETRELVGDKPWGVGILGFVDRATRLAQMRVIEEFRPPFAIIAGGRPDQAAALEDKGVATYLHVPSPGILRTFLEDGARRFVFEGRECGGHVGPRSSFVLWELMVQVLLESELTPDRAQEIHVLFAGGIHSPRSAAMIGALAQPLVDRGMKIGVLLGSAYLFTEEIVATGAITPSFQKIVRESTRTEVLQTGPGHAIRCAPTEYTESFLAERHRLLRGTEPAEAVQAALEKMHTGRLRIASKGVTRNPDSASGGARYVTVSESEQRSEGMYMVGQVAALRGGSSSIRSLHESVSRDGASLLSSRHQPVVEVAHELPPPPAALEIAVVGMGCLLPGANNPESFWQNILSKHDAVTEIPPDRFDYQRWFDEDRKARDKMYSKWGGFLSDVPIDLRKFGIPPAAVKSIEPMQLLALEVVDQALCDAGYRDDSPYKSRTGVIFGAGGGLAELGATYTLRAMLPHVLEDPDPSLYDQLPEWTEDSFAGILLNVIAGRISNRFDLGGPNFTVDAACASSLAAIYLGARELVEGTCDIVIAGGADTVQNPLSYMCFAKTEALSPTGRSRAFDASADGIVISEGLAAVVLRRLEDAERDGDKIYAVMRAIAGGSDGRHKGITAPCPEGQSRTLRRTYAQARVSPATVGLFEAHGTGTAIGDPTESTALVELLRQSGAPERAAAFGSVKSMIGHTKATAGVAGFIKAVLALHHRVLPATLHVDRPNPKAALSDGPLYLNNETRPWLRTNGPRRAGVSSFGFGGTNFHAVLDEYSTDPCGDGRASPRACRSSELFIFRASDREKLAARVDAFAADVRAHPSANLANAAYALHVRGQTPRDGITAAVVAGSIDELLQQLDALCQGLKSGRCDSGQMPDGVYYESEPLGANSPLTFLFPGQGSQFVNMMRELAVEFSCVRRSFERADRVLQGKYGHPLSQFIFPPPVFSENERAGLSEALKRTDVAQPALGASGTAMLRLLEGFGLRPDLTAGHSYGELVALHAGGVYDEDDLYRLSWERGDAMVEITRTNTGADLGGMVAVRAAADTVTEALETCSEVWLANLNAPMQTIISGSRAGLESARERLEAAGIDAMPLQVGAAFHSPLVAHARERFAAVLRDTHFEEPRAAVYNNATYAPYAGNGQDARSLLADNLIKQVRFAEQLQRMYADGGRVFVEVGPGNALTRLVGQNLAGKPHAAVATHERGRDALISLHHALAALAAHGLPVNPEPLFGQRSLEGFRVPPDEPDTQGLIWLVNGAYARPAGEPPRNPRPRARMRPEPGVQGPAAIESRLSDSVVDPLPTGTAATGSESVFHEFQETMRKFLRTQEAVLDAYLRGGAPADEASTTVAGAGLPEDDESSSSSPSADDIAAPPAPEEEPAELTGSDMHTLLIETISERTGYPPDMLEHDADLETDLGIDSIKRVEIIAAFRKQAVPGIDEPPVWFMEELSDARTTQDIVRGVQKLLAEAGGDQGGNGAARISGAESIRAQTPSDCARCIARAVPAPLDRTCNPPDGVVLVTAGGACTDAILQALAEAGCAIAQIDPESLVDRESARAAVDRIRSEFGPIGALMHLAPLTPAPEFPGMSQDEWQKHGAAELMSLLFLLQALEPELDAAQDGSFAVVGATRGGGDFGAENEGAAPWRGGIAGLLKTAAKEWEGARFRAIDTDDVPTAELLLDELCSDGPIDIGYRSGERLCVLAVRVELPEPAESAVPHLPENGVVLVTGGAKGITAQVCAYLADRVPLRFVLLGRSPLPEDDEDTDTAGVADPIQLQAAIIQKMRAAGLNPTARDADVQRREILGAREIRTTLDVLRRTASEVEYCSVDVSDAGALEAAMKDIQSRYGAVDAVIHGAGVLEDKYIVEKDSESFDRVLNTKITPMLVWERMLDPTKLKLLMVFSSVAGFYGNPGQGDYAAANEILNRMARRLSERWPGRVVAMNWGPWRGAGMVTPEVSRQFEARGIGLIDLASGCEAVWKECHNTGPGDVRVIIGPGPWVEQPVAEVVAGDGHDTDPAPRTLKDAPA